MNLRVLHGLPVASVVVALPAAAAVLGLLFGRRRARIAGPIASTFAVLTVLAAAVLVLQVEQGYGGASPTIGPLATGGLGMPLKLVSDTLSALVAATVSVVGLAVQLFSRWYLGLDRRYGVFAATTSLFVSAMLLVVTSADLVLILVGWEVMGWCSYLLIGHESHREAARRAAYKAFLVTRVADLAFVIGILVLAVGARSSATSAVIGHWHAIGVGGPGVLDAALICLLSGIAGKSALLPFQDWLADAMEGPTPASALIHAATMVAAGTIVVARLYSLFALSVSARTVLAILTAATMVFAAVLAFGQRDLKRLLAWSTVSQVAIMLSALSIGAGTSPGVVAMIGHAMYKALLFLAIGWLSVLAGGTGALAMNGAVVHFHRLARPLAIGFLALAGVPPVVGFFAKELVVDAAAGELNGPSRVAATVVLVGVLVTVPLTAAYCTRAWLVLSHRLPSEVQQDRELRVDSRTRREVVIDDMFVPYVPETEQIPVDPAEEVIGDGARWSVVLLSGLSLVGGAIVLVPMLHLDLRPDYFLLGCSLLLIVAAALAVRAMVVGSRTGDAAQRLPQRVRTAMSTGLGFDTVYLAVVAQPVLALARAVLRADDEVIDAGVRGLVRGTAGLGRRAQGVHGGVPSRSLLWLTAGVLVVAVLGVSLWSPR